MRAITPEAARANPLDESYCNVSPEAVEVNNRTMRKRRGRSSRNLRTKFRIESLYAEIRTLKRENEALARILAEIRRNQGVGSVGPLLCNLRLVDDDRRSPAVSGSWGATTRDRACTKGPDDCDEEDHDSLTDG